MFAAKYSIFRNDENIIKRVLLQIVALTFCSGCITDEGRRFRYPSEKEMHVRYLCRLPYLDATAHHQPWAKSIPTLIIVQKDKAIVYFKNDRTFVLSKDLEVNLPPGKYNCSL